MGRRQYSQLVNIGHTPASQDPPERAVGRSLDDHEGMTLAKRKAPIHNILYHFVAVVEESLMSVVEKFSLAVVEEPCRTVVEDSFITVFAELSFAIV